MSDLIETCEGLALANGAWREGYAAGRKDLEADLRGKSQPVTRSPYSAPLLSLIKAGEQGE